MSGVEDDTKVIELDIAHMVDWVRLMFQIDILHDFNPLGSIGKARTAKAGKQSTVLGKRKQRGGGEEDDIYVVPIPSIRIKKRTPASAEQSRTDSQFAKIRFLVDTAVDGGEEVPGPQAIVNLEEDRAEAIAGWREVFARVPWKPQTPAAGDDTTPMEVDSPPGEGAAELQEIPPYFRKGGPNKPPEFWSASWLGETKRIPGVPEEGDEMIDIDSRAEAVESIKQRILAKDKTDKRAFTLPMYKAAALVMLALAAAPASMRPWRSPPDQLIQWALLVSSMSNGAGEECWYKYPVPVPGAAGSKVIPIIPKVIPLMDWVDAAFGIAVAGDTADSLLAKRKAAEFLGSDGLPESIARVLRAGAVVRSILSTLSNPDLCTSSDDEEEASSGSEVSEGSDSEEDFISDQGEPRRCFPPRVYADGVADRAGADRCIGLDGEAMTEGRVLVILSPDEIWPWSSRRTRPDGPIFTSLRSPVLVGMDERDIGGVSPDDQAYQYRAVSMDPVRVVRTGVQIPRRAVNRALGAQELVPVSGDVTGSAIGAVFVGRFPLRTAAGVVDDEAAPARRIVFWVAPVDSTARAEKMVVLWWPVVESSEIGEATFTPEGWDAIKDTAAILLPPTPTAGAAGQQTKWVPEKGQSSLLKDLPARPGRRRDEYGLWTRRMLPHLDLLEYFIGEVGSEDPAELDGDGEPDITGAGQQGGAALANVAESLNIGPSIPSWKQALARARILRAQGLPWAKGEESSKCGVCSDAGEAGGRVSCTPVLPGEDTSEEKGDWTTVQDASKALNAAASRNFGTPSFTAMPSELLAVCPCGAGDTTSMMSPLTAADIAASKRCSTCDNCRSTFCRGRGNEEAFSAKLTAALAQFVSDWDTSDTDTLTRGILRISDVFAAAKPTDRLFPVKVGAGAGSSKGSNAMAKLATSVSCTQQAAASLKLLTAQPRAAELVVDFLSLCKKTLALLRLANDEGVCTKCPPPMVKGKWMLAVNAALRGTVSVIRTALLDRDIQDELDNERSALSQKLLEAESDASRGIWPPSVEPPIIAAHGMACGEGAGGVCMRGKLADSGRFVGILQKWKDEFDKDAKERKKATAARELLGRFQKLEEGQCHCLLNNALALNKETGPLSGLRQRCTPFSRADPQPGCPTAAKAVEQTSCGSDDACSDDIDGLEWGTMDVTIKSVQSYPAGSGSRAGENIILYRTRSETELGGQNTLPATLAVSAYLRIGRHVLIGDQESDSMEDIVKVPLDGSDAAKGIKTLKASYALSKFGAAAVAGMEGKGIKAYMDRLTNFGENASGDKVKQKADFDLARSLVRASVVKGLGDFLQEINGVAAEGGYVAGSRRVYPDTGSADEECKVRIAPPSAGRLMLGNDRPSGERVALLLTHATPDSAVNPLAIGGYMPASLNYLLAFRTAGVSKAAQAPQKDDGCCKLDDP